ncbi:MAG: NUDIX domain-containing protein [Candidatus Nealsonbacteria bacterium]|nr:NUDIX domain-containing protein [Candidatus Nealsonbacteria bacterium]
MTVGKGAGIILIANDGRILLQHRDKNNRWNRGSWSEFGGQIESRETPGEAIRREMKEELGIKLADLKFFKKYELQRKKGIYKQFVFTASLTYSVKDLRRKQKEGKDLALFTHKDLRNLRIADYTKEILEDFFKRISARF